MDPITDLFLTTRVASVVHAKLEATAPWGLVTGASLSEGSAASPARSAGPPANLAHFGTVSRGHCWLSVDGIPDAMPLSAGDCFLLAPGTSYSLRDPPQTSLRSFCEIAPRDRTQVIRYGGGGDQTTVVSGWFQFDHASVKILQRLLPLLILVRADQAQSMALRTTLTMLTNEIEETAPGSDLIVNGLADVLFIQCIRTYFGSQSGTCRSSVLHAIFDPQIGVALKSMHEKVDAPWTVESLAASCGMSRSAFALRFKALVEETPLEYLTQWRMHRATAMLRKRDTKLSEVAKAVGYDTDAAFSKTFKRTFGLAPREYERSASAKRIGVGNGA